jgi:hypothetical protein
MKYEITIRQLVEYTPEEEKEVTRKDRYPLETYPGVRFSDKNFHEVRVLQAEVSKEEFEAVKKAIIGVF